MVSLLTRIGAILASIATFLTFQQAQISNALPVNQPSATQTPIVQKVTPTPDISDLINKIQDLQNVIASYTPEPTLTPEIIYVTPIPTHTPTVSLPTELPTPIPSVQPRGILEVTVNKTEANLNDELLIKIISHDNDNIKLPVTVTTDYPGLPSQFVLNNPGQISWFSICPMKDIEHNECRDGSDLPNYTGVFNFKFKQDYLDLERDLQITINQ